MESLDSLQSFAKGIDERLSIWTSVSPSVAEEKSRVYEGRKRHWQKLIFGQIILLRVANFVASSKKATEAIDQNRADEEAASAIKLLDENSRPVNGDLPAEIDKAMDETRDILAECPLVWARLERNREALSARVNQAIMDASKDSEIMKDDWQGLSDLMQEQRDAILSEVKELQTRIRQIEQEEAKPCMQQVQELLSISRVKTAERRETRKFGDKLERILADAHGIVAPGVENEYEQDRTNGFDSSFLSDEVEMISKYYELCQKKAGRIVTCDVKISDDLKTFELIFSPTQDWLRKLNGAAAQSPVLKMVRIVYSSSQSVYPSDISLKVDLSRVPQKNLEAIKRNLAEEVAKWKTLMLMSPSINLRKVFRLFHNSTELLDPSGESDPSGAGGHIQIP